MQPDHDPTYGCYCLKCHTPAADAAQACVACSAPFVGSGVFDKVRGPRPSPLFLALFHPTAAERAA